MKAKSIKGISTEEIKIELNNSLSEGLKPTLAIVFISVTQEWEAVRDLLDKEKIVIFGATTDTEFTEQGIGDKGIVILLLNLNPSYFKVILNEIEKDSGLESGNQIAEVGITAFSNPAFIISGAHIESPVELIVKGIVEKSGIDIIIAGGMCGSIETFEGTVFTNKSSSSMGMLSLILDRDKVDVKGIAVSGWKPVGTEKTITKYIEPWVHTIDNKPAMDVIQKYIGGEIMEDDDSEKIIRLNSTYPLQIKRKSGGPAMRPTLLFNKENKSVFIGGPIKQGDVFRFSLPPDFEVIETVIKSAQDIKETELPDADAMIVFSCVGRLESLGPMASKEIEGLAETWGKPMAGFFSLGEFGKVDGGIPEFHGTTCSWVALKEK